MTMSTILVVDDCQTIRLAVKRILTEAGYSVIVARDGEEALTKLAENPALIVLDVNMPGLDGYGFCERMSREDPVYQDIPIVFLTTENSRALEMLGREMGAYLQKPVNDNDLLSVVETQLS
ncbi:response regulator [Mariniblastus fucicola]|uniref:Alkaline phosphatase synthesis transcriptional regulatory protein PhoP n=1 Tax=Mariniblastus fucicola TaxID=980251 RepID=A0A5B9P2S0_9BACT|nr:response regulator [Mariniblastus fucicola]QEG20658.1 Alkaline phosphatase synthesis transcriptional regulatory protein PhoP [Mariniblastus fucicola]